MERGSVHAPLADQTDRERESCTATPVITQFNPFITIYIGPTHVRASACSVAATAQESSERRHSIQIVAKKKKKRRADSCPCQRMQKKRGIDLKPDAVLLLFLLPLEIPRHLGSVSPEMNSFLNPFLPFFLGASIETGGFILEKRCVVVFFGVALSQDGLRKIWRGKKNENPFSFWVS